MSAATSPRRRLITVILASWLTLGGFVDGFAHRNLDTPETFFTPWHAVLYSGFLAVAFWLAWLVIRSSPQVVRFALVSHRGDRLGEVLMSPLILAQTRVRPRPTVGHG